MKSNPKDSNYLFIDWISSSYNPLLGNISRRLRFKLDREKSYKNDHPTENKEIRIFISKNNLLPTAMPQYRILGNFFVLDEQSPTLRIQQNHIYHASEIRNVPTLRILIEDVNINIPLVVKSSHNKEAKYSYYLPKGIRSITVITIRENLPRFPLGKKSPKLPYGKEDMSDTMAANALQVLLTQLPYGKSLCTNLAINNPPKT
ncbi:hypothetical protein H8356DRAFT_1353995 [Neocallimastix lanati (nom. inval.)]|nr:hypothetical protein H8356DRAFT_1343035 [Neocallimastix sp. JGI-2020a]KAG4097412.1 hypothetical protein H8356DRAFT_1353995 [Neocallimastix sp. JGI-2020a]